MKNLSLIAAILFTIVLCSCGSKKEKTEETDLMEEEVIAQDSTTSYEDFLSTGLTDESDVIDSSKSDKMVLPDSSKEVRIDPPVNNKTITQPKKDEPKQVTKPNEKRYYIVAGSFKKYSNAQNLFNYFKKRGYSPLILPKMDGYNRVAIVSYSKEADARQALSKLRIEYNDLTFWLYSW
jgi:cell division protein FtsN